MFDFISYMRSVAVKLKAIGHSEESQRFYRCSGIASLEEVLSSLTHGGYPAIVAEDNLTGRLSDNNSDNVQDRQFFQFYVFDRIEFLNHDHREEKKKFLHGIYLSVLSRFLRDKQTDFDLVSSLGLRGLEVESFSYRNVGPFADNLIGISVSFTILQSSNIAFNPGDWIE